MGRTTRGSIPFVCIRSLLKTDLAWKYDHFFPISSQCAFGFRGQPHFRLNSLSSSSRTQSRFICLCLVPAMETILVRQFCEFSFQGRYEFYQNWILTETRDAATTNWQVRWSRLRIIYTPGEVPTLLPFAEPWMTTWGRIHDCVYIVRSNNSNNDCIWYLRV